MYRQDFEGVPQRPIPADGEILECFSEGSSNFLSKADVRDQTALDTAYPYKTHFSFSIPSSSDLIYFMSRGDYGHGSLEFIVSDQAGDDVKVDVVAEYYRPRVLKSSNVCLLSRKNNERGIGFYVCFLIFVWKCLFTISIDSKKMGVDTSLRHDSFYNRH